MRRTSDRHRSAAADVGSRRRLVDWAQLQAFEPVTQAVCGLA
jgi:hypothetical protein